MTRSGSVVYETPSGGFYGRLKVSGNGEGLQFEASDQLFKLTGQSGQS